MIPLRDDNPSGSPPIVTIVFIVACVLVFLWQLSFGAQGGERIIYALGVVPAVLLGQGQLPPDLSLVSPWMTVFTSMFMHGGWMHLIGNMLYLWIFGDNVEDAFGHAGFAVFYLATAAISAWAHAVLNPSSVAPLIGASGAIAAILGVYFVLYPRSQVLTAVFLILYLDVIEVPAVIFLGVWLVMQLAAGLASMGAGAADGGMAIAAHLTGFGTGLVAGAFLRRRQSHRGWKD